MGTKKKALNQNVVIAEFMGYESYRFRGLTMFVLEDNNHRTAVDLHYDISSEWLDPVIKKCLAIGYKTPLADKISAAVISRDKCEIFKAVIRFIEHHNKTSLDRSDYKCRHCGGEVTADDEFVSDGYFCACLECDEDFYRFEVVNSEKEECVGKAKNKKDTISMEEWENDYCPVRNGNEDDPFNGFMFETYGADMLLVNSMDENRVWTAVDSDGKIFIIPGLHKVNRVGYFITKLTFEDKKITVATQDSGEDMIVYYNERGDEVARVVFDPEMASSEDVDSMLYTTMKNLFPTIDNSSEAFSDE